MSDDHLVGELNGEELSTDPGFGGRESPIDEDVGGEYMSDDIFLDHVGEYSFVGPLVRELNEKELAVDSLVQDGDSLAQGGEYSSGDHLVEEGDKESCDKNEPCGGKSPVDSGCGLLDGVSLEGPLFDPVEEPGFCGSWSSSNQFSTSDQPGLGGAFFQFGAFSDD